MSVMTPRRPAVGYALLEALIAVIVTSIGFIGAARLQTLGMSFNNSAGTRQKAVLLVYQMTDRMRANQEGVRNGAYNLKAAGSTACLTAVGGCTPAQLAQADMGEWLADVQAQLPNGEGVVCVDSDVDRSQDRAGSAAAPDCDNSGSVLAVKVWWSDKSDSSGARTYFATTTRPAQ